MWEALERVLERASVANLRFKLTKCFFVQYYLEALGMIVGCGVVKADPKKVKAIAGAGNIFGPGHTMAEAQKTTGPLFPAAHIGWSFFFQKLG